MACLISKRARPHIKAFGPSAVLRTQTLCSSLTARRVSWILSAVADSSGVFFIETAKKKKKGRQWIIFLFPRLFIPEGLAVSAAGCTTVKATATRTCATAARSVARRAGRGTVPRGAATKAPWPPRSCPLATTPAASAATLRGPARASRKVASPWSRAHPGPAARHRKAAISASPGGGWR